MPYLCIPQSRKGPHFYFFTDLRPDLYLLFGRRTKERNEKKKKQEEEKDIAVSNFLLNFFQREYINQRPSMSEIPTHQLLTWVISENKFVCKSM